MSQAPLDKPQYSEATQKNQPWFHGRFDIEEGGIERVTDDQRLQNTTKFWNAATFWYDLASLPGYRSVLTDWETGSVQTWPLPHSIDIGSLGGSLGLGFWDCFIVILVVNLASDLLPAWTATVGLTGLRMTTFSCATISILFIFIFQP